MKFLYSSIFFMFSLFGVVITLFRIIAKLIFFFVYEIAKFNLLIIVILNESKSIYLSGWKFTHFYEKEEDLILKLALSQMFHSPNVY